MNPSPRLFLDSSALIAGVWSSAGGARELLRLGEANAVSLLVSSRVLEEVDAVLGRKAPGLVRDLALLLDRCRIHVAGSADAVTIARCTSLTGHAGDGRILADACAAEPDYLVTLDKKHLLGHSHVAEQMAFGIGTPGDCIAWLRDHWAAASLRN